MSHDTTIMLVSTNISAAWRAHVGEHRARDQADAFALPVFANDNDPGSFEQTLKLIADIVADQGPDTAVALWLATMAIQET